MIHPSYTFDYLIEVPPFTASGRQSWIGRPHPRTPPSQKHLLGRSPTGNTTDVGPIDDVLKSHLTGRPYPRTERTKITLTASADSPGVAPTAEWYVAKGFLTASLAGDQLHLVRTANGGMGMSLVRDDKLIAAVGAVSAVQLGTGVAVRIPLDLVEKAQVPFRSRDPDFEFREVPVEIDIQGNVTFSLGGRFDVGGYDAFVIRTFYPGTDAMDECMALSDPEACDPVAANQTALMLDVGYQ